MYNLDPCGDCPINATSCERQTDGSVVCVCPAGYDGTNCEIYIGFCHSDPCLNGGTCMEIINNFTCSCTPPLTGRLCEVDLINECDPNPCINGTCADLINSYTCTCFEGFTDNNCSTNIGECDLCRKVAIYVAIACAVISKFLLVIPMTSCLSFINSHVCFIYQRHQCPTAPVIQMTISSLS